MAQLCVDASESEWYRLFKRVDGDGSGAISYNELRRLVREELKLTPKQLPEAELHALWLSLDEDGSASIGAGADVTDVTDVTTRTAPPRLVQAQT